jgi:hypothetical protein
MLMFQVLGRVKFVLQGPPGGGRGVPGDYFACTTPVAMVEKRNPRLGTF